MNDGGGFDVFDGFIYQPGLRRLRLPFRCGPLQFLKNGLFSRRAVNFHHRQPFKR